MIIIIIYICDYGGIGRRARLRIWCLGVEVRVLLVAPTKTSNIYGILLVFLEIYSDTLKKIEKYINI